MALIFKYLHTPSLLEKKYTEEEIKQALIDIGWEEPWTSKMFFTLVQHDKEFKYDESNELHRAIRAFSDPNSKS